MNAAEIEWADPPPNPRGGGRYGRVLKFVEALKERPGQWAVYPYKAHPTTATKSQKRYPGTEWTVRNIDRPDQTVYARWIGTDNDEIAS